MIRQKRTEHKEGEKLGECVFISYAPNDKHQCRRVNVRCRCGKEFTASYSLIKLGKTKSCGCAQRESARNQAIQYETGQKIGHLIFLSRAGMSGDSSLGNFLCPCGREFVTRIQTAKEGRVKSCGCMSRQWVIDAHTKHEKPKKISSEDGRTRYKLLPSFKQEEWASFWSKVELKANPFVCWNWTATGDRYGSFRIGRAMYKANRIAYFLHYGIDPKELSVLHSCDNPKCCNPNHLSLGTHLDNMQDMANKGRSNKGSTVNSAKLKAEDILRIREMDLMRINKKEIAKQFGVSVTAIYAILNFKTWDHIQ